MAVVLLFSVTFLWVRRISSMIFSGPAAGITRVNPACDAVNAVRKTFSPRSSTTITLSPTGLNERSCTKALIAAA